MSTPAVLIAHRVKGSDSGDGNEGRCAAAVDPVRRAAVVGQVVDRTRWSRGNWFDDSEATVAVDDAGNLVLRIRRSNGRWVCAEVIGEEVTGYGRYEWTVRTVLTHLDRNVVCGMFTWSDDDDFPHNREIDVEVSAWGGTGDVGGMFVVQPACLPGHVRPFAVPNAEPWRCWFEWTPEAVVFGGDRHRAVDVRRRWRSGARRRAPADQPVALRGRRTADVERRCRDVGRLPLHRQLLSGHGTQIRT